MAFWVNYEMDVLISKKKTSVSTLTKTDLKDKQISWSKQQSG